MILIKRGLDLPMSGAPEQTVCETKPCTRVAVLGPDYMGMKPTMVVQVADQVKKGQVLFTDKKCPKIRYTAPASGHVTAIHRGQKRALQSVVIQIEGDDEITYASYSGDALTSLTREQVVDQLLESGLWTALRQRPFSKVADPDTVPHSIFVTAMDTNPLAPSMDRVLDGQAEAFAQGIRLLAKLTAGSVFICKAPEDKLLCPIIPRVKIEEFSGPHPAGNVGTHIHFLDPVSRQKTVWHIGLQDVISVGKLFTTGKLCTDRIISLAGPGVTNPRLIRTQIGADLSEIIPNELKPGENRVISGSVLSGHQATEVLGFLGRYHQQVSVVPEDRERRFLGWLSPGLNLFSTKNILLSSLFKPRPFDMTTSVQGQVRAILPSGTFEDLMPMDIMPLFLMRALAVDDVEEAEALGALELDEEDLSLCAFACPSKLEFGPILRRNLTIIEKEG
ncbi:MAG: Na(+)-translocating NADH-quinone reductase subunit A [Phycisphaerae bacterium]|nr:Na(+)-translocating NADH-quinone reductase subunit A [Phycisphaerae bacterium]